MANNKESVFAVAAALVVLFSAMWSPTVSIVLSIVALLALAVYEFRKNKGV